MAIKQKVGKCIECPAGTADAPLIAKRCQSHYWRHRSKVSAEKPRNQAKNEENKVLGTYFANEVLQMPRCCEECDAVLPTSVAWMRRATVAHILKKRSDYGFPSVAIHPLNKMFLCIDCHTNFDNLGDVFILKMKMLPEIKSRVAQLLPLLTPGELNKVPEYLL